MVRDWLLTQRDNSKMSQEEVAYKAGITRQYYGMIESGARKPSVEVAKKIANILGFNWTLFFENECNLELLENQKPA
ncbi:helix-turn-helix transcriptional regulator [Brevibacillus massiliensis]|uniref:helix-turn-helix transcriptional regulator n=1 Tax=Brevibacillus massiliensis TaxID=1118054 RepID=UPI000363580A|nr:helix-turn-helix transcriptional regulator [Brevibacillus massiliensis]